MKLRLYNIYDRAASCCFGIIVAARTDEEARRGFAQLRDDPKSQVGMFPHDYALIFVGEQDQETGQIVPPFGANHIVIMNGGDREMKDVA